MSEIVTSPHFFFTSLKLKYIKFQSSSTGPLKKIHMHFQEVDLFQIIIINLSDKEIKSILRNIQIKEVAKNINLTKWKIMT